MWPSVDEIKSAKRLLNRSSIATAAPAVGSSCQPDLPLAGSAESVESELKSVDLEKKKLIDQKKTVCFAS